MISTPPRLPASLRRGVLSACAVAVLAVASPAHAGLVINPTYATNILSDANDLFIREMRLLWLKHVQNTATTKEDSRGSPL